MFCIVIYLIQYPVKDHLHLVDGIVKLSLKTQAT